MRPQLRPGLLTAWRAPGRLQLGAGEGAVVLEGLTGLDEHLLDALDGSCDLAALRALAVRRGGEPDRADALVAALQGAGALRPAAPASPPAPSGPPGAAGRAAAAAVLGLAAPDGDGWAALARRAAATAVVVGASATGLAVARTLACGGVGTVLVEDDAPVAPADTGPGAHSPEQVGLPRAAAAAEALAALGVRTTPPPRRGAGDGGEDGGEERLRPDVVVLCAAGAHEPGRAAGLVREGVPHVGLLVRGAEAVVGPLVRPGETACLTCLDLHRADRDPDWARVAAQLARPPGGAARPEEGALAALAGALTAAQALAELDGAAEPAALGATLEVTLPTAAVRPRPWEPHPRCGCTWARGG